MLTLQSTHNDREKSESALRKCADSERDFAGKPLPLFLSSPSIEWSRALAQGLIRLYSSTITMQAPFSGSSSVDCVDPTSSSNPLQRPTTRSREPSNTSINSQDDNTLSAPSTIKPSLSAASSRSSSFTRAPPPFTIPQTLVRPGVEMLKVSAKSARRVKPRKFWLELGNETPEDGEIGLEVGVGVVGGQDVKLCWEKNGRGLGESSRSFYEPAERDELISKFRSLGFTRSDNFASVPLSRIRDLRFGSDGSPYRTSLHLPPAVEPRWMTIIYAIPPSSSSSFKMGSPAYKLVHFVANSVTDAELWRTTLEKFK